MRNHQRKVMETMDRDCTMKSEEWKEMEHKLDFKNRLTKP